MAGTLTDFDATDCSSILAYHAPENRFRDVIRRIRGAQLPVKTEYKDGAMHFFYDGRCDGNTAHYLEKIITGLIGLYKED